VWSYGLGRIAFQGSVLEAVGVAKSFSLVTLVGKGVRVGGTLVSSRLESVTWVDSVAFCRVVAPGVPGASTVVEGAGVKSLLMVPVTARVKSIVLLLVTIEVGKAGGYIGGNGR
jgi:hypothetical protein